MIHFSKEFHPSKALVLQTWRGYKFSRFRGEWGSMSRLAAAEPQKPLFEKIHIFQARGSTST